MQEIFDLLARCDCPLLVIGGHGIEAHGVSRQTLDVDCLIATEDRDAFDAALGRGGYRSINDSENFARYSHESPIIPDVDVLFVDRETFVKLSIGSVALRRGNHRFQVPGLANVIALKLHAVRNNPSREARDLGDIVELLRANPGLIAVDELKELCDRFGPPDIYAKLNLQLQ